MFKIDDIDVYWIGKYNPNKYTDNFAAKSRIFKSVGKAVVYFNDGSSLDVVTKYYTATVTVSEIKNRTRKLLQEVGIIQ